MILSKLSEFGRVSGARVYLSKKGKWSSYDENWFIRMMRFWVK